MSHSSEKMEELAREGEDFLVGQNNVDKSSLRELLLNFDSVKQNIPWKALEDMGWIEEGDRSLAQVAPYLLSTVGKGQTLYRKSTDTESVEIELWKSKVHKRAMKILAERPDLSYEEGVVNGDFLSNLSKLSAEPELLESIPDLLKEKGVILIYERGLPGIKTDGLVYKTATGVPVVALTLRYSRLDNFWFTLLHELAHVMKHYKLLDQVIIEDLDVLPVSKIEKQADRIAKNAIVPRYLWERCEAKYTHSLSSVKKLAQELSIHPALVAGMLRRELNQYTLFTDLINSVNTREIVFGAN